MRTNVTIPFIGKCLEESGLAVQRKDNLLYGSLAQDDDLIVGIKGDKIAIAVALPEGINETIWFTIESECRKREQFEGVFDESFKHLLESVRNYIGIRNGIQEYTKIAKGLPN